MVAAPLRNCLAGWLFFRGGCFLKFKNLRELLVIVLIAILMFMTGTPLLATDSTLNRTAKSTKQALWVADYFVFAELDGAHVQFAFGVPNSRPGGLTFDSSGNFWGTFCEGGTGGLGLVFELTQQQLRKIKSGGSVRPNVEFQNPYPLFDCPGAAEFDKSGNLWVANSGPSPSVMKYAASQLTTGGTVVPATVLTFTTDFGNIANIQFDGTGNLWLVNFRGVAELTSDQISGLGTNPVTPSLELTSPDIFPVRAFTFDNGGNLWVGGSNGPLQLFAATDLTGSGTISPTPLVTIGPATIRHRYSSFSQTSGLAIDGQGTLSVASVLGDGEKLHGNISEFNAAQIGTSGSPKPTLFVRGTLKTEHPTLMRFAPRL
jgi:hypothetical protein